MTDTTEYKSISSPCIGVCRLNESKVCAGCFRKSEEITYWRTYTDEERAGILEQLNARSLDALSRPIKDQS